MCVIIAGTLVGDPALELALIAKPLLVRAKASEATMNLTLALLAALDREQQLDSAGAIGFHVPHPTPEVVRVADLLHAAVGRQDEIDERSFLVFPPLLAAPIALFPDSIIEFLLERIASRSDAFAMSISGQFSGYWVGELKSVARDRIRRAPTGRLRV